MTEATCLYHIYDRNAQRREYEVGEEKEVSYPEIDPPQKDKVIQKKRRDEREWRDVTHIPMRQFLDVFWEFLEIAFYHTLRGIAIFWGFLDDTGTMIRKTCECVKKRREPVRVCPT